MLCLDEFDKHAVACGTSDRKVKAGDFLIEIGATGCEPVKLEQVHNAKIIRASSVEELSSKAAGCDGAITDTEGLALMVLTADCLPVFFYDPLRRAIGIAHAGWRGTLGGISKNVVNAMKQEFKSEPDRILVGFGPAIRQCCYEVGTEFLVHFPESVVKMARKHYFDVAAENVKQLLAAGVASCNIFDRGICTSCDNERFYSYRKEKAAAGRMTSIIMLKRQK